MALSLHPLATERISLSPDTKAGTEARKPPISTFNPESGQGSTEFLLAAIPILLLGLGCIEAQHWYFSRQAVSHALAQAARAAATSHADPNVLDAAFFRALLPLYAATDRSRSEERVLLRMRRRERDTGLPAWQIRIVSPADITYVDFRSSSPDLPQKAGMPTIDNDYIAEQHQKRATQGWDSGRGPVSGQTTLEANTLTLNLTWLHEPLLPGVRQLLRQLAPADQRYGSIAMREAGYLPIRRQVSMVMQSHPMKWPLPAHRRIKRATHPDEVEPPYSSTFINDDVPFAPSAPGPCKGLWCLPAPASEVSNQPMQQDSERFFGKRGDDGVGPSADTGGGGLAPPSPDQETGQRPDAPGPGETERPPDAADEAGFAEELDDCPGCC